MLLTRFSVGSEDDKKLDMVVLACAVNFSTIIVDADDAVSVFFVAEIPK